MARNYIQHFKIVKVILNFMKVGKILKNLKSHLKNNENFVIRLIKLN